jgi:hypothetical protein
MPVMPRVRRLVARRPWVQWVVIVVLSTAVAASVADAMAGVEAAKRSWGTTASVWVAAHDLDTGEPIAVELAEVPEAVRPTGAIDDPRGAIARHPIGHGEIVTSADVVVGDDSFAPPGWLVAPIREALPSGAELGERVQVVSDGFVLAPDGVVVGFVDDVTLVAVPPDVAPLLPAASNSTSVALLRAP